MHAPNLKLTKSGAEANTCLASYFKVHSLSEKFVMALEYVFPRLLECDAELMPHQDCYAFDSANPISANRAGRTQQHKNIDT